jgi:hypothetical protein
MSAAAAGGHIGVAMKRLVDLVDRGPRDDYFFPASSNETIFRRTWPVAFNAVPDIVEVGYQGHAAWGSRITVTLRPDEVGDMVSWICLRLRPRSWLGEDVAAKVEAGDWVFEDPSAAWIWASSLGTAAIKEVELQIGETTVERWGGEWMDAWSRRSLDAGRAPVWDADLYGQIPVEVLRTGCVSVGDCPAGLSTVRPTDDGYVYCWLPLTFLRRPQTAFPLVAIGPSTEVRLQITLRPFQDVVRRRAVGRTGPGEVPLGQTVRFLDVTGETPIPYDVRLPTRVPDFEDATVFAGVGLLEEPLRGAYMREPLELLYEPVTHMVFDVPDVLAHERGVGGGTVSMQLPLRELNGPVRELVFFLRRKAVWAYNEWTNYGSLLEPELAASIPVGGSLALNEIPQQRPMLRRARLLVENAVWRDEAEEWWRVDYALAHRGGVRSAAGMVYGFVLGDAARWTADMLQPAGTVNVSRAEMRLDLEVAPPAASPFQGCEGPWGGSSWEVHVFAVGINWMRFSEGVVGPLFKD